MSVFLAIALRRGDAAPSWFWRLHMRVEVNRGLLFLLFVFFNGPVKINTVGKLEVFLGLSCFGHAAERQSCLQLNVINYARGGENTLLKGTLQKPWPC